MAVPGEESVTALYDYTANEPEELSIRKNEQLVLLDAKFSWWKVRNNAGKVGLVPSNYLRREKGKGESFVNRLANKITPGNRNKGKQPPSGGLGGGPSPFPSSDQAPQQNQFFGGGPRGQQGNTPGSGGGGEEYVVKFNYDASKDDELTLQKGHKVKVIQMDGDGWWLGQNADNPSRQGWFPSNYVTKADVTSASDVTSSSDVLSVVRTLYAFNSGNSEELAFEQEEMLDIIDQPPDDPEWWMGRNADGTIGLVPKNYVEVVPDAQPVGHPNYDQVNPTPNNGSVNNSDAPAGDMNEWFYGRISRVEAERCLEAKGQNGEYLVRDSETASGYSISMKMPGRIRHFKVSALPNGEFGIGQRKFESLEALLAHYKKAPIYTSPEQGKAYLTKPLPR